MSSIYLNLKEIMKWQEDANRKIESIADQLDSIEELVTNNLPNNLSSTETNESIMEMLEILSSIEIQQKSLVENANEIKGYNEEIKEMSDQLQFHMHLLEKDLKLLCLEKNG